LEPEQYYALAGSGVEDVKERVRDDAADTVRKELVLDAVAREAGITADEEAVMHEVEHIAEDTDKTVEEVAENMRRNGTFALLEEEITRRKALDLLVENAIPVPMPPEEENEVQKAPGAEAPEPEPDEARVEVGTEAEGGATTQVDTEKERSRE
jgi:trigger factor